MPISLTSAVVSPAQIPNGTTSITITFQGKDNADNTDVIVYFEITPFTELSFDGGSNKISFPYKFNKTVATFTRTIKLINKVTPSLGWKSGLIVLDAVKVLDRTDVDRTAVAIVYQ